MKSINSFQKKKKRKKEKRKKNEIHLHICFNKFRSF